MAPETIGRTFSLSLGGSVVSVTDMIRTIHILIALVSSTPYASAQQISPRHDGTLETRWITEDQRLMQITKTFSFTDQRGVEWPVPPGAMVDGASIPRFLWTVLGAPFTGLHRVASVVHDYYCVAQTRKHEDTHRVFYEAMLVSGVSSSKAWVMYQGVKQFGPTWSKLRVAPDGCQNFETADAKCLLNATGDGSSVARTPTNEELKQFEALVRSSGHVEEADEIARQITK
jgi:Protein of unknown function (DUF1353)